MSTGLHHLHKRKRFHEKLEPIPSPDRLKNLVDKAVIFVVLASQVFTVPQIYKIWMEKNAQGVSLITWAVFGVASLFWLFYGILHKERIIVFSQIIWIILYALIIAGVIIFG